MFGSPLSANAQAILLLTAPLIAGRRASSTQPLKPGEYKRLARCLRERRLEPADLLAASPAEARDACQAVIEGERLEQLLGRGLRLSQAVERWQSRAIWVVSRADPEYPRRFKARLREDAPPVIYGCGPIELLQGGGLAVVGSRHVDPDLLAYTEGVGRLAAEAGAILVSGGARGIDQAAMSGALATGGQAVGILGHSLGRAVLDRDYREGLMDGRLALVSPYDPSAGFNVGHAMQRNKLIYALADAALVVSAAEHKGGTWTGAVEQLEKLHFVPVYVRNTGLPQAGLRALIRKGAHPWPESTTPTALRTALAESDRPSSASEQLQLPIAEVHEEAGKHGADDDP